MPPRTRLLLRALGVSHLFLLFRPCVSLIGLPFASVISLFLFRLFPRFPLPLLCLLVVCHSLRQRPSLVLRDGRVDHHVSNDAAAWDAAPCFFPSAALEMRFAEVFAADVWIRIHEGFVTNHTALHAASVAGIHTCGRMRDLLSLISALNISCNKPMAACHSASIAAT